MKVAVPYTTVIQRLLNLIRIADKFQLAGLPKKNRNMDITDQDIRNLLLSLNKHRVKYILVGDFAVNIRPFSRAGLSGSD
jgi:hypothetical protein